MSARAGGARGLVIAAPASGSGKTLVTLALLRLLSRYGTKVASLKIGPDYIDPAFHRAAGGGACANYDGWAMRPATRAALLARIAAGAELVLAEGVMGLFDGAVGGRGSTAEAARELGWPVILVVDAKGIGASAAALIEGFKRHDTRLELAGVLFNRVGGPQHVRTLTEAAATAGVRLLGCLPRDSGLVLPSRHLGLVQAEEHPDLEALLERAADRLAAAVDVGRISGLARPVTTGEDPADPVLLPPPGQRIAVARDRAFAFTYPAVLEGWRAAGTEIHPFSPLDDMAPDADADAVYLPGGYPELHAGRIAAGRRFMAGLRAAAHRGAVVYGECGGYMVLGEGLVDAEGRRHAMAGLLPLECSFAERRLALGYRSARLRSDHPFGAAGACFAGHEFHYATVLKEGEAPTLFDAWSADGASRGPVGRRVGTVSGSFLHLIDRAEASPGAH